MEYFKSRHCLTIAELAQIIHENAPDAIKTGEIKNHFGRKVAIVSYALEARAFFTLLMDCF